MTHSDFGEDDFAMVALPGDFPMAELLEISEYLASFDVFVPGYIPPEIGLYHPDGFIYGGMVLGIKTILLPDRNIVSRMAQLAKGELVDDQRRAAASIMVFCQCLDIEIEPSIAFHELAPNHGNEIALTELAWFRAANNADPRRWMELAMGRAQRLDSPIDLPHVEQLNLAFPLRRWRRNYIFALKIGSLELINQSSALDKVLCLLEWMHKDFFVGGPALRFACVYFAPNSPPRRGMLKHLRAPERARSLAGAKNAAWDVTYLSDFVDKVMKSTDYRTRYILTSFDESLRAVAQLILGQESGELEADALCEALARWWPSDDARAIVSRFYELLARADEPERQNNKTEHPPNFIDDLISYGEAILLNWKA